jgi:outer membrane biosynthesis protein TonB
MRRRFNHFNYCAQQHIEWSRETPRVVVEFVIDHAGRTVEVRADSSSPYAACLERAVRQIVFDIRPERPLHVTYPIHIDLAH